MNGMDEHFSAIERQYASEGGSEFYRQVMGGGGNAIHYGYYPDERTSMAEAASRATEELFHVAGLTPGEWRALDLGSGRGAATHYLAERGARVTALDCCRALLEENEETARVSGLGERVRCVLGSYEDLPEEWTGEFDVVWSQEAICHARDPQAVFDHARRVLKPGGVMVFSDIFAPADAAGAEAVFNRVNAVAKLSTVRETDEMLRTAGFSRIHRENRSSHLPENFRRMAAQLRNYEASFAKHGLDSDWLEAFGKSLEERLRWRPGEGLEWAVFVAR